MFHSARLKLTFWYLVIITFICVIFSLVIFSGINSELSRFEHLHQLRIEREENGLPSPIFPRRIAYIDPDMIAETRQRITIVLILINLGIISISGGFSYLLAGKTLQPIQEMVDEQNRFIGDASHELRTPLTALKTSMEVSLRNKDMTVNQTKEILRDGLSEVNDLKTLTDNLLLLTQYQKANGNTIFENIMLSDILNNARKKTAPLSKQKNIKIDANHINHYIYGNEQSLLELFIILLDNAIKYSPAKSTILISAEKSDGFILVKIKDKGVGIAQKDIPYIFDRFYRADLSRTKNTTIGFGLGLSIAKRIMELHNGKIDAESKPGLGTTFIIQIPAKKV